MWNVAKAGTALDSSATALFRIVALWMVKLLIPLSIIALMMGVARVVVDLAHIYRGPSIAEGFDLLLSDILSMFVVIELLKSVVDYFEVHRLKLTFVIDAAVVFLLREVMIGVYRHAVNAAELAAIAALLLVLGAFRVAAVRFPPEVGNAPRP
ncbi:phosphate-starvation-inducible PsiE family protein [Anaeromyxobacter oryzisoli]|jgi:uncharacterized membrane protein (DUF373 family)|uniref:phosphate-starvation-inducible PsiE family protein n=1 Tax=Anaeromyxobacter oryzisoli TaxID=2925408 RepID=UPI001F55B4E2|nr:phosphate-starvation-inducible PsiE family protein [Anaeromyxobacter sp. SG63]